MRVLIEFDHKPLLFKRPKRSIVCFRPERVASAFEEIEEALAAGYYVAGFLSYEAGFAFEPTLAPLTRGHFPLMYFGVYGAPAKELPDEPLDFKIDGIKANISKENYFQAIEKIRAGIASGDVYQITYCLKMIAAFSGSPWGLYRALKKAQPVPYAAYLEAEPYQILSLSPEMFVRKTGAQVVTKPMKGSWPSGQCPFLNWIGRRKLKYSPKNRAENVMIADLLRNDLGRIGTNIRAPKLFEVDSYRTIHQMTSTVVADVRQDIPVIELFKAIFPSGSVTGAPKIRAMEMIRGLETEERRIYTGAIGYIAPNRDMFFNVPIRTILIDDNKAEMGIGGGIVWDSTPEGEWEEGLWKARFLTEL
ncbi:MAG: chorismate-binding protein [Candidatus Omnitrophica bacterium]|nr:chorismate-binding protein [Candidatus Omnitrophota bacterium]